ncbi:hypothetical protein [Saccharopolyspora sp. ASAGF58]|uniref:hypothetical protein n=1 Tax=Saccharopolyspora sp. ASAGF58 TaxID=2719023 RepID=UPI001B309DC7|nr:hypothetical protein [Saccharopolyspora sp. ASAGF58]
MVLPIIVGGYLLTRESDRGNTDEIMQKVGFNHPEKYKQIHEGKGPSDLSGAVLSWEKGVGGKFDAVHLILDAANKKANLAWTGQAAEEHGASLQPMSQFIEDAKNVSTSVSRSADQQVGHFFTVKNSMPKPVEVTATDNLLEKGGAWLIGGETDLQKQEREATEKAQEAKQHYDNYSQSTTNVSQNLAFYPKAPEMAYDQGGDSTGTNPAVGRIPNGSGIPGGGGTPGGGGGGGSWVSGTGGSGHSGSGSGTGDYITTPSQSNSQWSSPPVPNGPGLPVNTGPGLGSGPNTGGPGFGMVPGGPGLGGGSGAGAGAGRGLGAGGAGGRGAGLGAGGRAGLGGLGSGAGGAGGAAGAAGRGGAGGMGAGAGGRGRGKEGEEDMEHEDKYWVDTDEAWEDLGLPKVAPPVFGE